MVISLAKGGSVSLSREAGTSTLSSVTVGLGWDKKVSGGVPYDLDLSAILLTSSRVAVSEADFVFYNNPSSSSGAVVYGGDNRDGEGEGDDEIITIDLLALPAPVQSVVIIASIDQAAERGQSFGGVQNAFIRVVSNTDNRELARFDLTDGADSDVALVFGELYRDADEWKFQAIGDGYPGGLLAAIQVFGIVAE